jgi:hypothetical protein
MGNSLASIISTKLYPQLKKNVFPLLEENIEHGEAKAIKKHLTQLFRDMHEAILPLSFEYKLKPGSAIGEYAEKINIFSFLISLRVTF